VLATHGSLPADEPNALDTDSDSSTVAHVPVLGRIAAGGPILAEQSVEYTLPLPRDLVGEGELFSLKVVGDSMVDAAICDGDWVVVRRQPTCENGDIVAALLDDEATVKTFKQRDGHVWLMPHNPAYRTHSWRYGTHFGQSRDRVTPNLTRACFYGLSLCSAATVTDLSVVYHKGGIELRIIRP